MENEAKEVLEFVENNCDLLKKMPKQLTEKEAESLVETYGKEATIKQLAKMDNRRETLKNRSVYLTCRNWFEMDIKKGFFKPINPARQPPAASGGNILKQNFLKRYPIGTHIESVTGRKFEVISNEFIEEMGSKAVMPINQIATKEFKILS